MSKYSCSKTDCTVAVTEKCLLSHVPVETCPNVSVVEEDGADQELQQPQTGFPTILLHHGNEIGLQQISELSASRYGHLVGVLGAYGTGKTCLLSALYLLASAGDLRPTRLFAGSITLPGFESRVRLLRKWAGPGLPDKIVDHTRRTDPRLPGFLHLSLERTSPIARLYDLFFTDLPGEWTTDLIQRSDVANRFRFLKRADSVVITIETPRLLAPETRNSQIQSARMLLQRLRDAVGIVRTIPLVFALTRCDISGPTVPTSIYQIVDFARELGFSNASHVSIAAFSNRTDVPSGMGLSTLLDTILPSAVQSYPHVLTELDGPRMFTRFRYAPEARE
jgi:hypothetical protein